MKFFKLLIFSILTSSVYAQDFQMITLQFPGVDTTIYASELPVKQGDQIYLLSGTITIQVLDELLISNKVLQLQATEQRYKKIEQELEQKRQYIEFLRNSATQQRGIPIFGKEQKKD